MCPKDTDAPRLEKLKRKLLSPDADGDRRTDRGNSICPFHHSSNGGVGGGGGGGIKIFQNIVCLYLNSEA